MDIITGYRILQATAQDAPVIARGIVTALHIGEKDAAISLDNEETDTWLKIFTTLAARTDSQYSYLNALKAVDGNNILGIVIGYDGARLQKLREPFFETVKQITGADLSGIPDETNPGEWYLDSLAVWPQYRGHGIGRSLLEAACRQAHEAGKPAGLLVDKANHKARRLYENVGFHYIGDHPFVDIVMDHMQY